MRKQYLFRPAAYAALGAVALASPESTTPNPNTPFTFNNWNKYVGFRFTKEQTGQGVLDSRNFSRADSLCGADFAIRTRSRERRFSK